MPDMRPGLLVIADGGAREQAVQLAERMDFRLTGAVDADAAEAQLARIVHTDLVLLVWDGRLGRERLSPIAGRLGMMADLLGTRIVVLSDLAGLDDVFAAFGQGTAQILCDAEPMELALALAMVARATAPQLRDISQENEAVRLQRLSEEVSRIARALDALTGERGEAWPPAQSAAALRPMDYHAMPVPVEDDRRIAMEPPPVTAVQLREVIRARRLREQYLPGDLFADPAWDMMLDLMAARLAGERVSVSSLCIAASVPPTTALRWIRQLTDRGLLTRDADPNDGRRIFIDLSDETADALIRWHNASRRSLALAAA
jgi:hypothetical protein